jgi:phosphate transport system permease protein
MVATADAQLVLPSEDLRADRTGHIRRRTWSDRIIGYLFPLLFLVALIPIADLIYWISQKSLPYFSWSTLTTNPAGFGGGLYGPIVGSLEIIALATLLAILLGLFGGVAAAEFLSERSANWVRTSANLLAGTPSVIIGYFGYFAFVLYFGWGLVLVAGVVTLAIFITPYVFRATDLAFASVPPHIREAAFGAGARRHQYLVRVATPIAFPQILTGIFLAMAIGIGETAPLVLTTCFSDLPPSGLGSCAGYLTGLIWADFQSVYPGQIILAFQSAFLLLVIVIGLNVVVRIIAARYRRRLAGLYQ